MRLAIIETGGKQYRVSPGQTIKIEKLGAKSSADDRSKPGDKVAFDKVLLIDDGKTVNIGTPYITGAKVEGEFLEGGRDKKVLVMKYKSKTRYRKKYGHRQPYSTVKIK